MKSALAPVLAAAFLLPGCLVQLGGEYPLDEGPCVPLRIAPTSVRLPVEGFVEIELTYRNCRAEPVQLGAGAACDEAGGLAPTLERGWRSGKFWLGYFGRADAVAPELVACPADFVYRDPLPPNATHVGTVRWNGTLTENACKGGRCPRSFDAPAGLYGIEVTVHDTRGRGAYSESVAFEVRR
ncbi:MAG TPA: hypothetical protein VM889_08380 [Candidatus Thermoplasmatota archaeon]|nr:hypothetical protein [Candidatus Thermoplasmatota archaeon]